MTWYQEYSALSNRVAVKSSLLRSALSNSVDTVRRVQPGSCMAAEYLWQELRAHHETGIGHAPHSEGTARGPVQLAKLPKGMLAN